MREHSIIIDTSRCMGCTTCIKECPAEAIRVRNGKAAIIDGRCIDCGQCVHVCRHSAINATSDNLLEAEDFKYKVALPHPALFGEFFNLYDINIVINALLEIGFDDVVEPAYYADLISQYIKEKITDESLPKPIIASSCPTILRLIETRFPKFIPNVIEILSPMQLAAVRARQLAVEKTGLKPEEIGIVSIAPCSSMVTECHRPENLKAPVIDYAVGIKDIYKLLLSPMKNTENVKKLSKASADGLRWAYIGGESKNIGITECISVDGIESCIRTLSEIENGAIPEVQFIELRSCILGCVGGSLCVENPFGAKLRVKTLMETIPASIPADALTEDIVQAIENSKPLEAKTSLTLSEDRQEAFKKMLAVGQIRAKLPGLDCGACGAPACHALAEDIVQGDASIEDCFFHVRAKLLKETGSQHSDEFLPAPFRKRQKEVEE